MNSVPVMPPESELLAEGAAVGSPLGTEASVNYSPLDQGSEEAEAAATGGQRGHPHGAEGPAGQAPGCAPALIDPKRRRAEEGEGSQSQGSKRSRK